MPALYRLKTFKEGIQYIGRGRANIAVDLNLVDGMEKYSTVKGAGTEDE